MSARSYWRWTWTALQLRISAASRNRGSTALERTTVSMGLAALGHGTMRWRARLAREEVSGTRLGWRRESRVARGAAVEHKGAWCGGARVELARARRAPKATARAQGGVAALMTVG